jgi:hypothetical protein
MIEELAICYLKAVLEQIWKRSSLGFHWGSKTRTLKVLEYEEQNLSNSINLTAADIEKGIKLAARGSMEVNDGLIQIGMVASSVLGIVRALVLGEGGECLFSDHD